MRVFSAIDDSRRIATPGVNWKIDGHICTVLVVACLGYSKEPSRSANVVDTRATEIIVRDVKYGTSSVNFSQMKKVGSLALLLAHGITHILHSMTHQTFCRSRR